MRRRQLLKIGLLSSIGLALAGGGVLLVQQARSPAPAVALSDSQRAIFRAIARGVLVGTLPNDPTVAHRMLDAHLLRVETAIRQFPPHVRAELNQLMLALDNPIGRRAIAGLATPWDRASTDGLHAAFETMRLSGWTVRQQAYHALRDITSAAYFAEPGTWASLGYPGPMPV